MTEICQIIHKCRKELRDVSTNDQGVTMIDSDLVVISYDDVAKEHARYRGYPPALSSNDALFFDPKGHCTFIEFKNGAFKAKDLHEKSRESILIALDFKLAKSLHDIQTHGTYILVYNPEKVLKQRTDSMELNAIFNDINIKANALETALKDRLAPQRWLFKEAYAFTSNEFIEYIKEKDITTDMPSIRNED